MPDPFERHSRPTGCCDDFASQPSRSQLRRIAAVEADAKRPPGKKDPALCKAAHWKGPHRPEIRARRDGFRHVRECKWDAAWTRDEPGWFCCHEEACAGCGKVLRDRLPCDECPDFRPVTPEQHAAIMAEIGRRRNELAVSRSRFRKPPIAGPQGYRRRRSA